MPIWISSPPPSPIYRQYFTPDEIRALDDSTLGSAVSEIAILRILITRVLAAVRAQASLSLESRLAILIAFCHAAATLASLARLEVKRRGPPPSALDLFFSGPEDEPLSSALS